MTPKILEVIDEKARLNPLCRFMNSRGVIATMYLKQFCQHENLVFKTVQSRIVSYGRDDPRVFIKGKVKAVPGASNYKQNFEENEITRKLRDEWDRRKCKRGYDLCRKYSECSSQRLKLNGKPWRPPPENNTDLCYEEPTIQHNAYQNYYGGSWIISLPKH
jgi:hypothetical protein